MARDWTKSTLGERIEFLWNLRGVTQNELGKRAGLKSGSISRLANKTAPVAGSLDSVRQLADAWDVPLEWLAYGRRSPFDVLGGEGETADPVPERATVIAMARQLTPEHDRDLYEAAIAALRARALPVQATRDQVEAALCEEVIRARQLRDRMAAQPTPIRRTVDSDKPARR